MHGIARAIDVGYGNTKYTYAAPGGEIQCGLFPSMSHWSTVDPPKGLIGEKRDTVAVPVDHMFHEVGPDIAAAKGRYRGTNMYDGGFDLVLDRVGFLADISREVGLFRCAVTKCGSETIWVQKFCV